MHHPITEKIVGNYEGKYFVSKKEADRIIREELTRLGQEIYGECCRQHKCCISDLRVAIFGILHLSEHTLESKIEEYLLQTDMNSYKKYIVDNLVRIAEQHYKGCLHADVGYPVCSNCKKDI